MYSSHFSLRPSLSHFLYFSHTHTHTLSLSLTHTHTHTLSHSHTLSLSLSLTHSPTHAKQLAAVVIQGAGAGVLTGLSECVSVCV